MSTVSKLAASPEQLAAASAERPAQVPLAIFKIAVTIGDSDVSFLSNFHDLASDVFLFSDENRPNNDWLICSNRPVQVGEYDMFKAFEKLGEVDVVEERNTKTFILFFDLTVSQSAASLESRTTVNAKRSPKLPIATITVTLSDPNVSLLNNFHNLAGDIILFSDEDRPNNERFVCSILPAQVAEYDVFKVFEQFSEIDDVKKTKITENFIITFASRVKRDEVTATASNVSFKHPA